MQDDDKKDSKTLASKADLSEKLFLNGFLSLISFFISREIVE